MRDVYELCPILENERFLLRLLKEEDTDDLLKVYSDEKAVPYFNGDNCHGDNFYYSNYERMKEAMKFWLMSYDNHWFVRFTEERIEALKSCGFVRSEETLVGDDGTRYGDYWIASNK